MCFQCDAKDMVCNIDFGWLGVRSTRRPIALELHPTPQLHSRHLDKGMAGAGRLPSLLAAATLTAKSYSLPFNITYWHAYTAT
jgi:hypothetical protein